MVSCNCSCLSICLSFCLSIYLSTYLSLYLSIYEEMFIYLSFYLSIYIYLSASLKTKLLCETSSILELDNIKNAASLRDFLNFWTWQRQKRSYSVRPPHFFKLTTSKMKQFCETSFKNRKLSAELTASYQCVLRFFHSICLKCIRSAAPVTQNHLSKPTDLMFQNATPLRKSAP